MFSCLYLLDLSGGFLSANIFSVHHLGTRGEENFPSRMGKIGIREPDG